MRGGQNQILKLTELLKSDGVVCKTAQMRKTQFHYNELMATYIYFLHELSFTVTHDFPSQSS